jgi:hypothetical protein
MDACQSVQSNDGILRRSMPAGCRLPPMLPCQKKVHKALQTHCRLFADRGNICHMNFPHSLQEVWCHCAVACVVVGSYCPHFLRTQEAIAITVQVTELLPNLLHFLQHSLYLLAAGMVSDIMHHRNQSSIKSIWYKAGPREKNVCNTHAKSIKERADSVIFKHSSTPQIAHWPCRNSPEDQTNPSCRHTQQTCDAPAAEASHASQPFQSTLSCCAPARRTSCVVQRRATWVAERLVSAIDIHLHTFTKLLQGLSLNSARQSVRSTSDSAERAERRSEHHGFPTIGQSYLQSH